MVDGDIDGFVSCFQTIFFVSFHSSTSLPRLTVRVGVVWPEGISHSEHNRFDATEAVSFISNDFFSTHTANNSIDLRFDITGGDGQ